MPNAVPSTDSASNIRIACVQYRLSEIDHFNDFTQQVTSSVEEAAHTNADFIVFPEYFSLQIASTLKHLSGDQAIHQLAEAFTAPLIQLMSKLAKQHDLYIIAGSHPIQSEERLTNESLVFNPDGTHIQQPKLHITPFERETWKVQSGHNLHILETPKATVAVQICYDIEFPEASHLLAEQGVDLILVPYCTDDAAGHFRVSRCAQARAIENQIYVATAGLVGGLEKIDDMDTHFAESAVYTPCDLGFPADGVLQQAPANQSALLIVDLDLAILHALRESGSVTPRNDRRSDLSTLNITTHRTRTAR